ncbi:SNF7 family protein [Cardiosporidium cionae]|uniref:SNF7 family protein n=1 Tax=Cardiosporidium cionae TaxID=476202 RepID=A0ABQ7JF96_9APIC|nr:SNF7 family protein [Cardiosporidium cionae]|eukprot:KAF8822555.1 SNF7 family protein [Cardiosporidium cionae]
MRLFGMKTKRESAGGASPATQVNLASAIAVQKQAIEVQEKRYTHLETKIKQKEEEAKDRFKKGDKSGAIFALQQKKLLLSQVDMLKNTRLSLESQILGMESAQTQQIAVKAMKQAVDVQKEVNQSLDLNSIDKLVADLNDQKDLQNDVSQVLSSSAPMFDEDDLIKELEDMATYEFDEQLASAASNRAEQQMHSSPLDIPSGSPTNVSGELQVDTKLSDEDQLKALMGELVHP